MEFKTHKIGFANVVCIIGDIDALTSGQMTEYLDEYITQKESNLILDLSQVNFMSSAGLRAILGAVKKCRLNDGDLYLVAPQPGVARVLKMSGFENILKLFESVEQAIDQFSSNS